MDFQNIFSCRMLLTAGLLGQRIDVVANKDCRGVRVRGRLRPPHRGHHDPPRACSDTPSPTPGTSSGWSHSWRCTRPIRAGRRRRGRGEGHRCQQQEPAHLQAGPWMRGGRGGGEPARRGLRYPHDDEDNDYVDDDDRRISLCARCRACPRRMTSIGTTAGRGWGCASSTSR